MKSAKPTPQRPARPRAATPDTDREEESITPSRGKHGAPAASVSTPSAAPRANNSGKDSASRGGAENAEDLPEGWTSAPLGSLFEFKYGKSLPQETRCSTGTTNVYGSNGIVGVHDRAITKGPTIIIGRKGSVGEVHISSTPCWPIDTTYYIDEFPEQFPAKYWALFLKSLRLGQQEKSSAIPGISRDDIYQVDAPLPPVAEQRRIVAKLEEVLGKVEASRQRLAQVPTLLKRFRQAVLAAACSGRLTADWRSRRAATVYPFAAESPALAVAEAQAPYGRSVSAPSAPPRAKNSGEDTGSRGAAENAEDLPEGWSRCRLGDYVENLDGQRVPISAKERESRKGEYPYYGASGVIDSINGYTHDGSFVLIGEDGANLLSRSTPIAYPAHGKIWVNNHAHVLRCRNGYPNGFFCAFINSIDLSPYVTGTAQPKLNQANMNSIPVPVPPLPEQEEIVRRVEALFAVADRLEARFEKARAQVDRLAPALLAKAFRGELVPQDPRDPPAAATA